MPDVARKPDPQDANDLRNYLTRMWEAAHDNWRKVSDPWYFRTVKVWNEEGRPSVVPPKARGIIDHATDVFMSFTPTFHRATVGDGQNSEKDRDDVEAALLAVFMDAQQRQMEIPFKTAARYMNAYGYAVIEGPLLQVHTRPKEPIRDDYKSEMEYEWAVIDYKNSLRFWNPIEIRAPHPATILLDHSSREPAEAVIPRRMLVRDVRRMLEEARTRREDGREDVEINESFILPDRDFEEMKGDEFWTNDWHWVTMGRGDEFLYIERNAWGFLPYSHGFAGYSHISVEAALGERDSGPRYMASGLLDPVEDMLRMHAQGMSAKHNALIEQGFPRPGYRGDPSEAREQLGNTDGVLEGNPTDWWWFQVPELNRSVFQIGDDVEHEIAGGTYVTDVAGMRQVGVDTVGQQAILSQASNRKFDAPKVSLDYMVTVTARNILRLVDRLGESIQAGGVKLVPKQIHHDYNVIGQFQVIDPILQLQKRELGLREVQMHVKSDVTYREDDLRVPNETEELRRLTEQEIRNDPMVKSMLAQPVAEQIGLGDIWAKRNQAMFGQNSGPQDAPPPPAAGGPQISDQAGGGATRSQRQMLTGDVGNPARPRIPEGGV